MNQKLGEYTERSHSELEQNLALSVARGLVTTIATPVIFATADEKNLLVGRISDEKLKLPDNLFDVGYHGVDFNMHRQLSLLGEFAFQQTPEFEYQYLGLIRHKPAQRRIIAPVIVNLAAESQSSQLSVSERWIDCAKNNRDQLWVQRDDLAEYTDGPLAHNLTDNTAKIINYYLGTLV